MTTSRGARFIRNFGFSLGGQVILAVLNLVFVRMLVHGLGLEVYGLYVLLHAAVNYLSLAVLGAGSSSIKFIAEAAGSRNGTALRTTLRLSALMHGLGPLIVGFAFALGAPTLAVRLFHVRPELAATAAFVLRCAAAASLFWAAAQWASSGLQGLHRFDAQNAVLLVQSGLGTAGAALLVEAGYGLRGAALWYIAANALAAGLGLLLARRLVLPAAAALPSGPELPARQFVRWSASLWLGSLAWIISFQFDRLFLARMASLTALTLYAVPANLLQRLQILPQSVGSVAVPLMAEMSGAREDLARVYLKAQRFVLWLVLPVLGGLFALMPQFLGLWLGGDFGSSSVWPARVLVLAQVCFALLAVPHAAATSRDRPVWLSAVVWAQAILSLIAWPLLMPRYGLLGVALGSLIAQAIPAVFYLVAVHGLLGVSGEAFLEALARPVLCASAMTGLLLSVHAKITSWPRLVGIALAAGLFFAGSAWALASAEDRDAARWVLRRALDRRRAKA